MSDIYRKFDKATECVGAFAILSDGAFVAKVVLKYPRDGAGRLTAFVHWFGQTMVSGYASGYGYDKASAAISSAASAMAFDDQYATPEENTAHDALKAALADDNGHDWRRRAEGAVFTVLNVC